MRLCSSTTILFYAPFFPLSFVVAFLPFRQLWPLFVCRWVLCPVSVGDYAPSFVLFGWDMTPIAILFEVVTLCVCAFSVPPWGRLVLFLCLHEVVALCLCASLRLCRCVRGHAPLCRALLHSPRFQQKP